MTDIAESVLHAESVPHRVPAEWEPQSAIWLSWPHNLETWPGRFDAIPAFFADWAKLIAESTPVRLLAPQELAKQCERDFTGQPNIDVIDVATNDCWIRDYGPTFVQNPDRKISAVNWRYNSWGGKYPPWDLDDAAGEKMCAAIGLACRQGALCLEGGALELDGRGRLLTTPTCLVTETRNPGWTEQAISLELHQQLGVQEIVWLDGGGLAGDDTDGHIDQLARFIDQENVVVAVSEHQDDPSAAGLRANQRQLEIWATTTTPRVRVHRLPIPPPRLIDGQRVPESYCNFLRLGPDRILVPAFGSKTDQHALRILQELSGAEATAVDCRDLVWGLGALHCASRDQPAET
ncbi:MAG: agmatine/peptidylarginine deiminase [Rubripirellula sp.]